MGEFTNVAYIIEDACDESPSVLDLVVSAEVAALLAEPEPRLKEVPFASLAREGRDKQFKPDDVSATGGKLPRDLSRPASGSPWEGPRFRFSVLLGEGRAWPIAKTEDGRCGCCKGVRLESYEYCLVCDQCGRELEIPRGEKVKRKSYRKGKLKGGVG